MQAAVFCRHEPDQTTPSTINTGVEFVNTMTAVIKEVGEMLIGIPYVQSLSGVILQIIRIRDEIKINKKQCHKLIDKVLRMAKPIYEKLLEVGRSQHREKLARLERHLNEYERELSAIYNALQKLQSRSRFERFVNRGLDELNEYDQRFDELNTQLILHIIFHITMEQASANGSPAAPTLTSISDVRDHVLPPKPTLMFEREDEVNTILNILLSNETSRVAILGGGGFGKTTLARAILHDTKIKERYQSRYFLSCEGFNDHKALLQGLADILGLKVDPSTILMSIQQRLESYATLLCLDNFETPWEESGGREAVEELLEVISSIPKLSLMITIRGEQHPSKVRWSKPLDVRPLARLSLEGSNQIVEAIIGQTIIGEYSTDLLEASDGIPLATTLMATLLQNGESSESLWKRWLKSSTKIIRTPGGNHRLSNLDRSIELSVNSFRMSEEPDARRLLAAFSILPDGFANGVALEALGQHLDILGIENIVETLRVVALIKDYGSSSRFQILSPVRLFCQAYLVQEIEDALPQIVNYYIVLLSTAKYNVGNSAFYQQIVPEVKNIHSVFQQILMTSSGDIKISAFVDAIEYLTSWSRYIGNYSMRTLQMALEQTQKTPVLHAKCVFSIGRLSQAAGDNSAAMNCFSEAAAIFEQKKQPFLEARSLEYLGDTLYYMGQLDNAEIRLKQSLDIYIKENSTVSAFGRGNVCYTLGRIYLSRPQFPKAEEYFTEALVVFRENSYLLGQANATNNLSQMYMDLGNLVKAEEFANQSLIIAKNANYARGEGNALRGLGSIYLRMDRVVDAIHYFTKALDIDKEHKDIVNQLVSADELGRAYIRLDWLAEAEKLLNGYSNVALDSIKIAYIQSALGWLYLCGGCIVKAELHAKQVLQLFQRFEVKDTQANALIDLGTIFLRSGRLDEAERILESIPDLGRWHGVEMRRLWALGDLYLIRDRIYEAEIALNSAMANAKTAQWSYQQGNIVRSMGILHIKRGRVDRAVRAFKRAFELHRKAQWVSEQATDLKRLGEAYEMLERFDEAATAFKESKDLMESVRESRQLTT